MFNLKYCYDFYCNYKINLYEFQIFLMRFVSSCFSPLNRELVEATRQRNRLINPLLIPRSRNIYYRSTDVECSEPQDDEIWLSYLMRPFELIRMIKRYHRVGNWFFVIIIYEFSLMCFILFKIIFHKFYTGNDQEKIDKLIDYFPRLCESYPNPADFYAILTVQCLLCLLLRVVAVIKLIKMAIINKDEYKYIGPTQMTGSFLKLMKISLRDWFRMIGVGYKHSFVCLERTEGFERLQERYAHLHLRSDLGERLSSLDKKEIFYFKNMINFSECYKYLNYNIDTTNTSVDWFMPESNVRIDIWELCHLTFMTLIGIPFLTILVLINVTAILVFELSQSTDKPFEASVWDSLAQAPKVVSNFGRVVRIIDLLSILLIQVPHQSDIIGFFIDLLSLNSRIRKITESLKEVCKLSSNGCGDTHCVYQCPTCSCVSTETQSRRSFVCKSDKDANVGVANYEDPQMVAIQNNLFKKCHPSPQQSFKDDLNQLIETHLELIGILSKEFSMMKRSHTTYMNILITGSGFCVALGLSTLYVASSGFTQVMLASLTIANALPVFGIVPLCFRTESRVSIRYTFVGNHSPACNRSKGTHIDVAVDAWPVSRPLLDLPNTTHQREVPNRAKGYKECAPASSTVCARTRQGLQNSRTISDYSDHYWNGKFIYRSDSRIPRTHDSRLTCV